MPLAMPAAEFATVPVAGKDCGELEHADRVAEKTAMAVSRGRFNASTFRERSAMGVYGLRGMGMAHLPGSCSIAHGLSQVALAKVSVCARVPLKTIEASRTDPRASSLVALPQALGMT